MARLNQACVRHDRARDGMSGHARACVSLIPISYRFITMIKAQRTRQDESGHHRIIIKAKPGLSPVYIRQYRVIQGQHRISNDTKASPGKDVQQFIAVAHTR